MSGNFVRERQRIAYIVNTHVHGKGVICAEPYVKMDGPYFARFIRHHFPILFDITRTNGNANLKLFVMDNDPSQTSAIARKALKNKNIFVSSYHSALQFVSNKCIHTHKNVFYQNNHFRFPSKFNAHLYS